MTFKNAKALLQGQLSSRVLDELNTLLKEGMTVEVHKPSEYKYTRKDTKSVFIFLAPEKNMYPHGSDKLVIVSVTKGKSKVFYHWSIKGGSWDMDCADATQLIVLKEV